MCVCVCLHFIVRGVVSVFAVAHHNTHQANSKISVFLPIPGWLHKHVIGKQGSNLKTIMADYDSVHINFNEDKDGVDIEGPPEDVEVVKTSLSTLARELVRNLHFVLWCCFCPRFFERDVLFTELFFKKNIYSLPFLHATGIEAATRGHQG